MIDGHIHFHKQPYTLEVINSMVDVAISKGIDELWLLDHSHKFKEFSFLYQNLKEDLTSRWYNKKTPISINEYLNFIKLVKSKSWPIKLKFGVEVCYFVDTEDTLRKTLKKYPIFDFIVGSVHYEFGGGIDINKEIKRFDVNELYKEYYRINECAVKSRLFTVIAHPDYPKLYQECPDHNLFLSLIEHFAITLSKYHQLTENNTGLLRHGYPYGGLSKETIDAFKRHDVKFHKSSDAHEAKDIGRAFDTIIENL